MAEERSIRDAVLSNSRFWRASNYRRSMNATCRRPTFPLNLCAAGRSLLNGRTLAVREGMSVDIYSGGAENDG